MKKSEFWRICLCRSISLIVFIGGALLMIILLSLTVKDVEQTEYAVGYDNYTMKFTEIYTQGRYVTKVGEYLIKLPRTLQEYKSELTCLTKDKVLIKLDVAMQYQYDKKELIRIVLRQFNGEKKYNTFIKNRVTSSILDTCLKYNAEEYYTIRGMIDISIYNELIKVINDDQIGSKVEFFQLVNIGFPQKFSDAITKKQTIQQEALTATNDRQSILTNARTKLYEAQRKASIILINANNTAFINLNKAYADASAQEELWNKRAYAYNYTAHILKLNSTQIINYIEADNVKKSSILITSVN